MPQCPDCRRSFKIITNNGYNICNGCGQSIKVTNGQVGNAYPKSMGFK